MRRLTILVVLAVACASSGPTQRRLAIDVYEEGSMRSAIIGPHSYTVRVRNVSAGAINIQSIRLDLAGFGDLDLEGGMASIGDTIDPGEEQHYQMSVNILPGRGVSSNTASLSQIRVTISCSDERGSFVADDTVYI